MIFSVELRQQLAQVLSFNSTVYLKLPHVVFTEHGGRGTFVKADLAFLHAIANPDSCEFLHAALRAVARERQPEIGTRIGFVGWVRRVERDPGAVYPAAGFFQCLLPFLRETIVTQIERMSEEIDLVLSLAQVD